jgi:hypothetical protein
VSARRPFTRLGAPSAVEDGKEGTLQGEATLAPTARIGWFIAIAALYLLHQDIWFWRQARPLMFGFLPVGLAYHGAYCVAVAGLMWGLTRFAWPSHLEDREDR